MQRLIKNGALADNPWQIADSEGFDLNALKDGHWLLPPALFQDALAQDLVDFDRCGLVIESDFNIEDAKDTLAKLKVLALNFKAFADGRSFSQARILREQLGYSGELRAVGEYMQDQLFYLSRCGFNAFVLPEDIKVDSALESLSDFSERYQAACDEAQPLFRRRA